jgi:cobalt/nickel transport system permease protein
MVAPVGGGGPLGRIDPRARIVAATLLSLILVAVNDWTALALGLLAAAAAAASARLPPRLTLGRLAAIEGFMVATLALLPFTHPGEPWFRIGPVTATLEGALLALGILIKANGTVLLLLALVGTQEPAMVGHALRALRVPATLVHILLFSVRYVDVLRLEYDRLRRAIVARAFRPRADRHTWQSLGYLIGMLLLRAFERAERVLAAMKCRGYHGHIPIRGQFAWGVADTLFLALVLGVGAAMVGLDRS